MLSFTLYQLGLFFRQELPGLVAQADASRDAGEFRARLEEFVARHAAAQGEAAEQIRLLIGYDGREVSELSTGEQMPVRTLELRRLLPRHVPNGRRLCVLLRSSRRRATA